MPHTTRKSGSFMLSVLFQTLKEERRENLSGGTASRMCGSCPADPAGNARAEERRENFSLEEEGGGEGGEEEI